MTRGHRSRPTEVEAAPGGLAADLAPIVPTSPDDVPEFFRSSYAVLVRGASIRRHLYFNLPAAERAVRRALARGDQADLILVELHPVGGGADV